MSKLFDTIQIRKPKRNSFPLPHDNKLSFNMGDLVPIICQPIVPGDTWKLQASTMVRFSPMLAPIMDRVNVFTYFWFIPYRLIWDDFEDFITGGKDGTANPVFPTVSIVKDHAQWFKTGSLADYLGFPSVDTSPADGKVEKVSSLPFRAYQLVYNEYVRDQNLQTEVYIPRTSGSENTNYYSQLLTLRKKCWEKDYFTSALPWAQRGNPVTIPLVGDADVYLKDGYSTMPSLFNVVSGNQETTLADIQLSQTGSTGTLEATGNKELQYNPAGQLGVDMSGVTAATINELRQAIKLQEWLELAARGGSRYIEQIYAFFGVKSSDARLQRPEYLGGGRSPVVISEVLQTSETGQDSPQGNMAGHGISLNSSHQFKRFFEEHGILLGCICVLPRTSYCQGIPREWQKFDRFDFYWPQFAHLGEQEVKNSEIYLDTSASANNDGVFGYQSRYAEYKYIPNSVHGEFRTSLDFWHMARIFSNVPKLNSSFVEADPTTRIFSVEDPNASSKLYAQVVFDIKAVRPMPKYGTPYF
jgi:hypothetical protein